MNCLALFVVVGAALMPISRAHPQVMPNPAPRQAKELVVKILSYFSRSPEFGSGIIVGLDSKQVYIATARHVIEKKNPASQVLVAFADSSVEPIIATPSDSARDSLDLAVLTIPRSALNRVPELDRLGNVRRLRFGHAVSPMGCPFGVCWGVPVPADRIVGVDPQGITFQSGFVNKGNSGGALFNQYWEVVGMITHDRQPRAYALPIDQVLDQVRAWGYDVSLRSAKVPRAGYQLHLGASLLTPLSSSENSLGAMARFPSGRIVATRRGELYGLTWHLSGLRLAPRNLAVTSAMGGVGVDFHWWRFTAQPFFEIGLGRVEGRYDAGGYFVTGTDTPTYVPFWRQQKQDGLGLGAGMSVLTTVAPHVTIELLIGHWNFSVPDSVPRLPSLLVGSGLRWGL